MTVELADLPRLTKQQFAYVQGVANGETSSDAARVAYPKCKLWSPGAQWAFASKLKKNSKVVVWLKHLRSAQMTDVVVTRQSYINRLVELMNAATEAGNHAVAVRAWELLGKVEGYYMWSGFEMRRHGRPRRSGRHCERSGPSWPSSKTAYRVARPHSTDPPGRL